MTEYIEREALKILFAGACAECRDSCAEFDGIEADCNQCLLNGVIKDAKSIPAADVRPVVRATWRRYSPFTDTYECSNCGEQVIDQQFRTNFCPNCGAKMKNPEEYE